MENWRRLSHLYVAVFLSIFSSNLVAPAITDVVVAAVCGGKEECSLAIYLTGFQQAITGLGAVVLMPLIGNLSDIYGRKRLLLVPFSLAIIPPVILAWKREKNSVYAYYAVKTITAMVTDGGVIFLGISYLADNVCEERRVSAFGLLCGMISAAIVCGNLAARLLSTTHIFQAAAVVSMVALAYTIVLLKETSHHNRADPLEQPIMEQDTERNPAESTESSKNTRCLINIPSPRDIISLLKRSNSLLLLVCVSFFNSLAEAGVQSSQMYSFKARFHFNKNQFAELTLIANVGSILSNMLFLPLIGPFIGDKRLLALGLIGGFIGMLFNSIAWSPWVLYASSTTGFFFSIIDPNLRSLVSRQIGPHEQGIAQGCIASITSLANLVAPIICSPLTALFLSEDPPFHFPGFSLFCIGLVYLMGYILSIFVRIDHVNQKMEFEAGHE